MSAAPVAGQCFHCGEALPALPVQARLEGETRAFCCDGCAGAARWIRDAKLDDYYQLRTARGTRVGEERRDYGSWDRDEVVAGHCVQLADGQREITVLTDGMHCAACAWLIDNALRREPGVEAVTANAVTGRVRIRFTPDAAPLSRLLARMDLLGYRPFLASGSGREDARRRERNRWLLRLGFAGLGAMQAMMYAEALYLDTSNEMPVPTRDFFRWIAFMLTVPVVFYSGWPFITGMWREWRARRVGMDTLVAGSSILALAASTIETLRGGPHVWYDAAVMFVFLLLIARMIEQRARNVASARVDALARAQPLMATREAADGVVEQIAVERLVLGDVVRVAPGEALPADGRVLNDASLNESLLTGESRPVLKRAGDTVYAGSLCGDVPARMEVTGLGANTRLSELTRLVEEAQGAKPRLARIADRIASGFVIALIIAAGGVYVLWRNHDPSRAFEVMLSVLVVSCPCALSLAIPAALAAAHGSLSRLGVLAVRGDALDALAQADRVVFDKTGTLTDGQPVLAAVQLFGAMDEARALGIAAALERDSRHPLAQAFAAHDDTALQVSAVTHRAGQGIEGVVDGHRYHLGSRAFATGVGDQDDSAVWLGDGAQAFARFSTREALRADAAASLAALRRTGLEVELLSGDGAEAVDAIAAQLQITQARARMQPEDKLAHVRALQTQGQRVVMVGDGINDAPVLAAADVSVAMGEGAALAHRAADIVLTSAQLARLPQAITLARRTRAIIRENLGWAIAYNVIALPLAATGKVTPWMAAIGMALSSLLVTLNALRLGRLPRT